MSEGIRNRPVWITLWLAAATALFLGVLLPNTRLEQTISAERTEVARLFGEAEAARIDALALDWLRAATYSRWGLFPQRDPKPGSFTGEWMAGRLRALRLVAYQLLYRLALLLSVLPALAAVLSAAAWDGYLAWRVRQGTFDYASPLAHRLALGTLSAVFPLMAIGLFAPFPLHSWVVIGWFVLPAAALRVSLSSLPKRV